MTKTIDINLYDRQLYAADYIDLQLRDTNQFIDVVKHDISIECDVITILANCRYRLLNEMDAMRLAYYDEMDLVDVDYIIIE